MSWEWEVNNGLGSGAGLTLITFLVTAIVAPACLLQRVVAGKGWLPTGRSVFSTRPKSLGAPQRLGPAARPINKPIGGENADGPVNT